MEPKLLTPPTSGDPNQPVAYDPYGRPLYTHPPTVNETPTNDAPTTDKPQVVYMSRSVDPHDQEPTAEVKAKHDESARKYPHLNLSDHEFVISAISRHPIGLISIWGAVAAAVLVIFIGFPLLVNNLTIITDRNLSAGALVSAGMIVLLVAVLFVLGGVIATVIYQANRFYLTNESVIQHIQTSLFTKKDQVISLANIEDASYRQQGILQTILNYGSIRLSTEGEETTYRFNFVADPHKQIDTLNNTVEAFKNFRPVDTKSTDD